MRTLVHDFAGHPFQAELSRELARRGHPVLHLFCGALTGAKGAVHSLPSDPNGLSIEPVGLQSDFERYSLAGRVRSEIRFGRGLTARADRFHPDVVISSNAPLLVQSMLLRSARRSNARFVYWQQDALGVAIRGELRRRFGVVGSAVGRAAVALERTLITKSDAVVAISPDFRNLLRGNSDLHVIENWAPLAEMPITPRENPWAVEHGLDRRRVALYSGTLGLKHDPRLLLKLAEDLAPRDVDVAVVAAGPGFDWIQREAGIRGVSNLHLFPTQPYERLPEVLATGDLLLAILEPDAAVYSVPSKILTYHCAGRPILAALPRSNLAARIIDDAQSGWVCDPSDPEGFSKKAVELLTDDGRRATLGRNARAYAERAFDIVSIGDRFEAILRAAGPSVA